MLLKTDLWAQEPKCVTQGQFGDKEEQQPCWFLGKGDWQAKGFKTTGPPRGKG